MKRKILCLAAIFSLVACENLMDEIPRSDESEKTAEFYQELSQTAALLSRLPLGNEQMNEVLDAVKASTDNGFDEEYMLADLFSLPGSGVGDRALAKSRGTLALGENENEGDEGENRGESNGEDGAGKSYSNPLRDLIRQELASSEWNELRTRGGCRSGGDGSGGSGSGGSGSGRSGGSGGSAGSGDDELADVSEQVEEYIQYLSESNIQIYWPYSENWDGETLPIITYDPGTNTSSNQGWRLKKSGTGEIVCEEVIVDENMAQEGCVWVINSNEDSQLTPLAYIRKTDPDWGTGNHGKIETKASGARLKAGAAAENGSGARPTSAAAGNGSGASPTSTVAGNTGKMLQLKKFKAKRNFDSWFCGGAEFFIKIGAVESFTANVEEDLQRYKPSITDFMVSVKRKDVGKELDFDAVLVSDWTEQLSMCAFLITEDDGGKLNSWNCSAVVKINSKSYGFEMSIPINSRDDIVWRGQLSGKYLNANINTVGHFGDVDLVFDVLEY
jgi:hypothetical protein